MKSIHHRGTESVSVFCPIATPRSAKRTLPFGQVHFDLLSDLGWKEDYPMHGFARTQHRTKANPAPRSGAEDFGLPRKSPRQAKHNNPHSVTSVSPW